MFVPFSSVYSHYVRTAVISKITAQKMLHSKKCRQITVNAQAHTHAYSGRAATAADEKQRRTTVYQVLGYCENVYAFETILLGLHSQKNNKQTNKNLHQQHTQHTYTYADGTLTHRNCNQCLLSSHIKCVLLPLKLLAIRSRRTNERTCERIKLYVFMCISI